MRDRQMDPGTNCGTMFVPGSFHMLSEAATIDQSSTQPPTHPPTIFPLVEQSDLLVCLLYNGGVTIDDMSLTYTMDVL